MAGRIKGRTKFSNLDILDFMGKVVEKHTRYYQSDFQIDQEILLESADRQEQEDKTFIWLCRTAGTWLLTERNVFIKDTREYNTFTFYAEQTNDTILAYVVEITDSRPGFLTGNVYALDYLEYYGRICSISVKPESVIMQYEHGCRTKGADERISSFPDTEYGILHSIQYQPHSEEELRVLLEKERQERGRFREGDPGAYIAGL